MFKLKRLLPSKFPGTKLIQGSRALTKPSFLDRHDAVTTKHARDSAEVVIIGGGCIGTSLAYHLAKAGQKDVILLEKSELTAGSTWHAAGLTTYYHPGINLRKLHFESIRLFETLPIETGQEVGFHATGSIRLAHSKEHMSEFKYMMTRHQWHEADEHLVYPEHIAQMFPLLNMDGILGGLYTPGDGHTDPYSLTMAYAIGARMYGATLLQDSPVTATVQRKDGTWDVSTPDGVINAKHVVNAAGFHGRQIAEMAGLDLPLVPIHHQYIVSASIPFLEEWKKEGKEVPAIRDLRGSYYVRQERTGLLIGPYEEVEKMKIQDDWYEDGPPKGFGKELFESDLDRLDKSLEHVMDLLPIMLETDIQSVVAGPITYSPDILPLMGPTVHLKNYWLALGFGYGIAHSGGAGKYLQRWMMNGEPDYDLIECDPDRYSTWTDKTFLMEKARESYGMNTCPSFPHEERWMGRPTERISGAYEQTKARNAAFGFHAGWEQPHYFATNGERKDTPVSYKRHHWHDAVGREVDAILNRVAVADVTPFGKIMLEGPGATKWLSSMVANTLPKVRKVNISHMLTPQGRVYAELTITRLEQDKYYLVTGSGSELHDLRWLKHHLPDDSPLKLTNVTEDMGVLALTGKYAREVMGKLTDTPLAHQDFAFLESRDIDMAGFPVQATRISYTGELGWELHHNRADTGKLYEAIHAAGEEYGIADYGSYCANSLRLEKGFRGWGAEMNLDKNPYEAGLQPFIKPNKKTAFIGQEACQKFAASPQKCQLVFMTVDTHENIDPIGNETIWYNNQVVGNTTSGGYSYQAKKSICFAYLPPHLADLGTNCYVELMGLRYKGTVVKEPMFDTEATRTRNALKAAAKA